MSEQTAPPAARPGFEVGYLVIYRNEDRTFSPGHYVHRERTCALRGIPHDEEREVLTIAEIHGVRFDRTCVLPIAQAFKAESLASAAPAPRTP